MFIKWAGMRVFVVLGFDEKERNRGILAGCSRLTDWSSRGTMDSDISLEIL